jgi:hypothetical protein
MLTMGSRLPLIGFAAFCLCLLFVFPFNSPVTIPFRAHTALKDLSRPSSEPTHNYAFSAFLAAPAVGGEDDNDDLYFVGTRILIYQLLHDPVTRTNNSYPFLVLVTEDVSMEALLPMNCNTSLTFPSAKEKRSSDRRWCNCDCSQETLTRHENSETMARRPYQTPSF